MSDLNYSIELLPIDHVFEDTNQPRERVNVDSDADRLMVSLKTIGLRQPISVSKQSDGHFMIIDGHRRYNCAKSLGWKDILCCVYPKLKSEQLEITRYEIQNNRRSWKPTERAAAIARLSDLGKKNNKEIAEALHISETTVCNSLLVFRQQHDYLKMMEAHGVPMSYQTEFRKLRPKLRKIQKYEMNDVIVNITDRIHNHVIASSKELRILGRIFLRAHANEAQILRYLSDPDMTVEELKQHTLQNGICHYIESFLEMIARNVQQGIPFSKQECSGLDRLSELINRVPRHDS